MKGFTNIGYCIVDIEVSASIARILGAREQIRNALANTVQLSWSVDGDCSMITYSMLVCTRLD